MMKSISALSNCIKKKIKQQPKFWVILAALVLFLLLILIISVSSQKPSTSTYRAEKVIINLPEVNIKTSQGNLDFWRDEVVQAGDTIEMVLGRFGISETEINRITSIETIKKQVQHLQVNQVFSIRTDNNGKLTDIQFFNDDGNGEKNLVVLKKIDDHWQAGINSVDTETLPTLKAVVVKTSARGALAQAGIPVEIRESLREIFRDKIDINTLESGDKIRLIYDILYYRGQQLGTGDIRAAEISRHGQLYRAYYYETGDDNNGQYYDDNGKPSRKGFTSAPVEGARISSPFGIRFHPIRQTLRMHSGIDYAVASGTPIRAPSDGVVTSIGVKGGYGNAIMLRHSDSMQTLYGHMSAFANIRAGQHIRAGEIIGYVGSTGVSTGPHLHYEVLINGQPVNPTSVALPTKKLNTQELADFKKKLQHWKQQLNSVPNMSVTVAQLD
ncbi:M23 family metallopeptidase [Snodgrassella sp. B3882]|uniref:M23 family metallopeptidase n=1 Tax=Snodgrassella sp. B3882 TaxID=2818037 RepID=UPI00226ABA71|nr:M23 family metallopeptidase [Snodgrassella sp. B3882]